MDKHRTFKITGLLTTIAPIIVLFIFGFFLTSCSNEFDSSYSIYFSWDMALSQEGFLYLQDDVLHFYDFISGRRTVLCNKPNCLHQPFSSITNPDPECNAVSPNGDMIVGFGMHNAYVYTFISSSINETTIYRQKPNGDGREFLTSFDWDLDLANNIIFKDNKAYFIGVTYILDEKGASSSNNQISIVLSVDLINGGVNQLTEPKQDNISSMVSLEMIDDKLYYYYVYYDEGMDFLADNVSEQISMYINTILYEVDIATATEKQLLNVTEDVNDIHIGLNNKAFIFFNKKISQVYSVDRKDSTKAPLIEGENIDFARYLNDYIVYSQGEDYSVLYFYDLPTGKIKKVNRPVGETVPTYIYDNWIFYGATLEDGTHARVFMPIEDYLDGNTDYITIN